MLKSVNWLVLGFLLISQELCADDLHGSIQASASAMQAQNMRLKIIAQNIANSEVTASNSKADPYRRKQVIFENRYNDAVGANTVRVKQIVEDKADFILKYEPHHPAASKEGYVKYPNVNTIVETVDAKEAQRSFEANLHAMEIAKSNQLKIVELMR